MTRDDALTAVLKRDRLVVGAALAVLVLAAGTYTALGVGMPMSAIETTAGGGTGAMEGMGGMAGMAMRPAQWTPGYAVLVFLMWWIMMIAMMLPSAAPMVLLHAAIRRRTRPGAGVTALTALFVAGYLAVWAFFSAAATALQWALELEGLVAPERMAVTSGLLGGAILTAAGLYQFTPLKHACLKQCRDPVRFLSERGRPGARGALLMGLEHGAYCLGCCWFVMALLFFGGIMNLWWIVGIALLVLAEKLLPHGRAISRTAGAVLVVCGAVLLAGAAGAG